MRRLRNTAGAVLLWVFPAAAGLPPDAQVSAVLARVSEEADVFARLAPDLLAQETLQQRAAHTSSRFHPRLGAAPVQPPKPQYRTREIISEYGFTVFRDASGSLHELRQIVSVDGRRVLSPEKARHSLAEGLKSDDDRRKKRMIEQFQKHGLTSAAVDFGQVLLLFRRRNLANLSFAPAGTGNIGADSARILSFRQTGGDESLMILERAKAVRQPLEGELWVRAQDSVPLRVVIRTARNEQARAIRDEATVDYGMSRHGVVVPVSVVHREWVNGELVVENVFRYSAFRRFGADAEIKFD